MSKTSTLASAAQLRARENESDLFIPYTRHVTDSIIALRNGSLLQIMEVRGVSFETADVGDLNALHNQLNILWRNVGGDERLAVCTHVMRHRETTYPGGVFASPFARQLDARHKARMVQTDLYRNDTDSGRRTRLGFLCGREAGRLVRHESRRQAMARVAGHLSVE